MNKLLTIVIISYKSKKLILSHIQKFYNKFKIIIIENSFDETLFEKNVCYNTEILQRRYTIVCYVCVCVCVCTNLQKKNSSR